MTTAEYRASESEASLQAWIIDFARAHGWKVAHFRPAQTAKGWRTAVSADGEGFFDLVLARGTQVLFVELKSAKGVLEPAQYEWGLLICGLADWLAWIFAQAGVTLATPPVIDYHIWLPSDRAEIEQVLL